MAANLATNSPQGSQARSLVQQATDKIDAKKGSNKAANPRSFWEHTVAEFTKSNMSKNVFCAHHGLARSTFWAWHKKLTKPENAIPSPKSGKDDVFSAIIIDAPKTSAAKRLNTTESLTRPSFTLNFNSHLNLVIPKDFDGPSLSRIVKILMTEG